jgi:histone H3/H4
MVMSMTPDNSQWRLCSTCKKPLTFGQLYYACSVSTCNRNRTFLSFCSVNCWDAHVPVLRHREAWAEEKRAPSREQWEKQQAQEREQQITSQSAAQPVRRVVQTSHLDQESERENMQENMQENMNDTQLPNDILIIASKLKTYIKARSGMNTSESVIRALSDKVRQLTDEAIRKAAQEGRKTVMDRDFEAPSDKE